MGSGMSLMVGDMPDEINLSVIGVQKPKLDISKFGFFESATPNFHTYYPGVKNAADIKPKEGDFIKPIFRLLSEVIVRKSSNPVDFSMNSVLKNSMPKLLGQTVYANHEALVGNEIGSVAEVAWQDGYTTDTGIKVPAGINGVFKIDAKSHPNIARGIMMEPPSIHSNSVTIEFGWEPSHSFTDIREFMGKVGTYGSDGQLIRRIANEIRNYHETSLVAHGADPFAQKVVDGSITNPEYADSVYSLSAQGKEKPKIYFFSNREDLIELSSTPEKHNHKPEEDMKDLVIQLAKLFGKPEAEITEKFIQDWFTANLKDAEALKHISKLGTIPTLETDLAIAKASLKTAEDALVTEKAKDSTVKLTEAETKITSLTTEINTLKGAAETQLTVLKSEAKRIYGVLKGDKADADKLALIDKMDEAALKVELKAYNEELEEKFPAKCNSCGGSDVTRNTAAIEDPAGKKTDKLATNQSVMDDIRKESKGKFLLG